MNTAAALHSWEGRLVDGKFPLLQQLASTPRSDVFLTQLPGPGSQKAVIKLAPAAAGGDADWKTRWERIAALSHPHLLRLFHMGDCELNSTPLRYVVMEYAEEDLSQILPSRALTPAETEEMLRALVDVLSFLHANGFVHGHIKPSNIMAAGDQLKLSSDSLQLSGKLSYRSSERDVYDAPEIKNGIASPAADIWSLGVTLVAALAQYPPAYDRSGQKELIIPESIPQPFRQIAQECVRLDPKQRCSLAQIKARLQPASEREEITSTLPAKHRLVPIAAAIVVIALLVGLRVMTHRSHVEAPSATSTPAQPALPPSPPVSNVQKDVVAGAVVERVLPDVPRSARNTIHGKIKVSVKVTVDASGKVSTVTLEHAGPSKYFAGLALSAARRWKFKAPQMNGQPVSSKWMLHFRFGRAGTEVSPVETSP